MESNDTYILIEKRPFWMVMSHIYYVRYFIAIIKVITIYVLRNYDYP